MSKPMTPEERIAWLKGWALGFLFGVFSLPLIVKLIVKLFS